LLTHSEIWTGLDRLAERHGLSPSGLARKAGLDPTTFNRSKRVAGGGKPRWPSTESLAKALDAVGAGLGDLAALVDSRDFSPSDEPSRPIPVIGLAQAGHSGFFDDGGFPVGAGWSEVDFPDVGDENAYALEITGDSMLPVYREGDVIIVSPGSTVRRGDRVVVKTLDGEVMAKVLMRRTARRVELHSLNPSFEPRIFDPREVDWIARIVWASQ